MLTIEPWLYSSCLHFHINIFIVQFLHFYYVNLDEWLYRGKTLQIYSSKFLNYYNL